MIASTQLLQHDMPLRGGILHSLITSAEGCPVSSWLYQAAAADHPCQEEQKDPWGHEGAIHLGQGQHDPGSEDCSEGEGLHPVRIDQALNLF